MEWTQIKVVFIPKTDKASCSILFQAAKRPVIQLKWVWSSQRHRKIFASQSIHTLNLSFWAWFEKYASRCSLLTPQELPFHLQHLCSVWEQPSRRPCQEIRSKKTTQWGCHKHLLRNIPVDNSHHVAHVMALNYYFDPAGSRPLWADVYF